MFDSIIAINELIGANVMLNIHILDDIIVPVISELIQFN